MLHFAQLVHPQTAIESTGTLDFQPVGKAQNLNGLPLGVDAVIPVHQGVEHRLPTQSASCEELPQTHRLKRLPLAAHRGILVERTVLEVKKLKMAILVVAMLAVLVGCGDENKTVDATQTPEQTEKQALPDTQNDDALMTCASAALSEIGVSDAKLLVLSDTNDGVTHDVNLEATHEGTPLTVSCFSIDGEWYVTSIYSEETKKFYWADDDVRVFQDIYDLKTGELISAKSKEIEDGQKELEERADKIVGNAKDKISSFDGGA